MVNNQNEFNNKYNKETKKIEIKRNQNFQGELVIENYSNLERLSLSDVNSIDKITLKNLPQLQECTIWGCGVKELVIENCPQIENLNVYKNSLTSLEFMSNLRNLTELEIGENPELNKILKPYGGDWRKWKGLQIRSPKGSSYYIQSPTQKNEKEQSKLETEIKNLEENKDRKFYTRSNNIIFFDNVSYSNHGSSNGEIANLMFNLLEKRDDNRKKEKLETQIEIPPKSGN